MGKSFLWKSHKSKAGDTSNTLHDLQVALHPEIILGDWIPGPDSE